MKSTGFVIAIDGPDGVGKTTQLKLLAEYLSTQRQNVYTTRASGGTPIGEELRKASLSDYPRHPETDVYISLAMHTELGYDLQKRSAEGQTIVVDRSPLAIVAYNGYGSQLEQVEDSLAACQKMLTLWQLDVLFLLEAPQGTLNQRLNERYQQDQGQSLNYFEKQGEAYFQRVHQGYQAAVAFLNGKLGSTKLVPIDASGSIEDIQAAIREVLQPDITT